jgi:dienelactone hydrolase
MILLLFFFILLLPQPLVGATFFGEVPTGLQNISVGQHGYALYVPDDYSADQSWALVIALPDEGEFAEEYIQGWVSEAKSRGFIVLSPNSPVPRGLPDDADRWILDRKHELEAKYSINPEHVLVTGSGFGGHYALYLGLKYPKEFTAIASIGDAFKGRFLKLFNYSFRKVSKVPVLILRSANDLKESEEGIDDEIKIIRDRGYSIEIVETVNADELTVSGASGHIFQWFKDLNVKEVDNDETSASVKERIYSSLDDFFQNR